MRKFHTFELALLLALAAALLWGAWSLHRQDDLQAKMIRLHVIANSDNAADQALKLQVRDAVLTRAEAILRESADMNDARRRLTDALPAIGDAAAAELAAADEQYVVCASRGDVAVLAVEEGEVKVLCRYTTEYDVGCVEVKASAEGCVVLLGEWVTNCLHVLTVAAGRVVRVVKKEMQSAIVSLLVTDVPADTHTDGRAETRADSVRRCLPC